ncbi:MAG: DNA polymerase III subunit delta [Bacteroidales bacterium]|nr:DNA polymerase III subunit delta [Bacteroidales bacterium]
MFFRDIIGQEDIKQRLIDSVKNHHIAHAQLFAGQEGVGKFQLAMAYSRYIHCTNRGETDACGRCPSCIKYNKASHPDLHFSFPIILKDSSSTSDTYLREWCKFISENKYFSYRDWMNNIKAENKQGVIPTKEGQLIIEKLSKKAYESDYKIMIIWLPEKMNEYSSNKILKLIEEPYENTLFLLVSNDAENILPTILSRSQRINVRPIDNDALVEGLIDKYNIDPEMAQSVAHNSSGNILKAIENITLSEDKKYYFELFISMMRFAYARKIREMKSWSETVAKLGREKQKDFLVYAQNMIRENFIYNMHTPGINFMNPDEENFSKKFSPFVNERNVEQIMYEFGKAETDIIQNVNSKIVFFDLSLKFIMLLKNN